MAPLTPEQRRRRQQVERGIRMVAPALSVLLWVGERISKVVEPEDVEYYPPRMTEGEPPPTAPPRDGAVQ
jgi:hypothetical protein